MSYEELICLACGAPIINGCCVSRYRSDHSETFMTAVAQEIGHGNPVTIFEHREAIRKVNEKRRERECEEALRHQEDERRMNEAHRSLDQEEDAQEDN